MKIPLMVTLFSLISNMAHSSDETGCRIVDSTEFQKDGYLSIDMYDQGRTLYSFCSSASLNKYFITIDALPSSISTLFLLTVDEIPVKPKITRDITLRKKSWVVSLTHSKYKYLHSILTKSVAETVNDSVLGLDGSTWCLSKSAEKQICYWTPTHDTSDRGLSQVVELGEELWGLVDFEDSKKFLY